MQKNEQEGVLTKVRIYLYYWRSPIPDTFKAAEARLPWGSYPENKMIIIE